MNCSLSRFLAALLLLGLAAAGPAQAGTCTFNTGGVLVNFGAYSAAGSDVDATGTVQFTCIPDALALQVLVAYTVSIDSGTGNPASFNPRKLKFGANALNYNLFTDPARLSIFGNGSPGTAPVSGNCAAVCTTTVYGRVFAGQSGPAGGYADEVVVTLDFN